jgi:ABC-type microcin C transport system permease subunit YejB
MAKTRLNLSLDQDLVDFAKLFAAENRTTVTVVITQYLLSIKRRAQGETTEKILAHPAFREAMLEVQAGLKSGKAEWHSFDEVFSD